MLLFHHITTSTGAVAMVAVPKLAFKYNWTAWSPLHQPLFPLPLWNIKAKTTLEINAKPLPCQQKWTPDINSITNCATHLTTDHADAGKTQFSITPPISLGLPDDWEACKCAVGLRVNFGPHSLFCTNMFGLAVVRLHWIPIRVTVPSRCPVTARGAKQEVLRAFGSQDTSHSECVCACDRCLCHFAALSQQLCRYPCYVCGSPELFVDWL